MRIQTLIIAVLVSVLAACGSPPPPPVLAHAERTAGLRVRIADKTDYLGTGVDEERDDENRKSIAAAQHALVVRLQEAGYVIADKGSPYDISLGTAFTIKRPRHEDAAFARAQLRVRDRKGEVVDEITIQFEGHHAPAAEPDRVAVHLVNELNKSAKAAAFAQKRGAAPASETAPAPPAP